MRLKKINDKWGLMALRKQTSVKLPKGISLSTIIQQLTIGITVVLLAGCATSRKRLNQNLDFPKEPYVDGVTHSDEVLDELGPPLKISSMPNGYVFMYESLDTKELQLGFSLPIPFVKWFKFVVAQADYDHKVMSYHFDDNHVLLTSGGHETPFDLGNTIAIQPVLTVNSMFDTSSVEDEIVHFTEWPAFCLMPLPQTINRAQSIDTGTHGVEQRGTAPTVGQRSPELHK
jgi:hypothetical protein